MAVGHEKVSKWPNMISLLTSRLTLLMRVFGPSYAFAGMLLAQPSLRIASPADGTNVHPGESLEVTVDVSPPQGAFQVVYIAGADPIGYSKEKLNKPPYRFVLQIPHDIRPDKYTINAAGMTSPPGQLVISNTIEILVERADSPVSIIVYPTAADFTMDQKRYLQVTGRYTDGTTADLTQSNRIKYVSSVPGVATVQKQGIVTPVTPGSAKITVTYGDLKLEVPVTVRPSRK